MNHSRPELRPAVMLDLQAYYNLGITPRAPRVKYGIDWRRFWHWSFGAAFLVCVCGLAVAIWWRG